ncbi:MAG: acetylglutamate kinase, partial [Eudoraea sp.]|nr:acetylglutamate kinase [Eudoraea sp.]NNK31351.1 acetylglutamate kinase [Flavobacteriaceae bacterium]
MKPELAIVKIGGNVIEDPAELQRFLRHFSGIQHPKILVHGGGKRATEVGKKLGVEARMVAGRRITDTASLDVALMVYAGLVNKKIVGQLQGLGCNAIGLSGA